MWAKYCISGSDAPPNPLTYTESCRPLHLTVRLTVAIVSNVDSHLKLFQTKNSLIKPSKSGLVIKIKQCHLEAHPLIRGRQMHHFQWQG